MGHLEKVKFTFESGMYFKDNVPVRNFMDPILRQSKGNILDIGTGLFGITYIPDFILDNEEQMKRLITLDANRNILVLNTKKVNALSEQSPFKSASFGAAISIRLFGYMANPELLLDEMIRLLNHDGDFILMDWEGDITSFDQEKPPRLTNFYPKDIVTQLEKTNHLKDLKITTLFSNKLNYKGVDRDFTLTAITGKRA